MPRSSISLQVILVYHSTPQKVLEETICSLFDAIDQCNISSELFLVDNGNLASKLSDISFSHDNVSVNILSGHGNVGFSCGNNLALFRSKSQYVLILNPDIVMNVDSLCTGIDFLESNRDVVMATPAVFGANNTQEYLCRAYPSIRGLWRRMTGAVDTVPSADSYELRHLDWSRSREDFSVASGCFMLCRGAELRRIGGFDERFFLYFEDYDLTIRLKTIGRCVYIPQMKVKHLGGGVSKKALRHRWYFICSAFQFFNKHGWRW